MSPSFNSGVGCALIISLAIDQIFCLAPSIKPPIEPVVSRTKQTSMRDLDCAGGFADSDGFGIGEDGKRCACPTTASFASRFCERVTAIMRSLVNGFMCLLFSD